MTINPSLPPMALTSMDRIRIDARPLKIISADSKGVVAAADGGFHEAFTHKDLYALLEADRLQIDESFFSPGKAKLRLEAKPRELPDLDEEERRWVKFKHDVVTRFIRQEAAKEFSRSDNSLRAAGLRIHSDLCAEGLNGKATRLCRAPNGKDTSNRPIPAPSPYQLQRWLRRFEQHGCCEEALIDGYHRSGNRGFKLPEQVRHLIAKHAPSYCDDRKVTGRSIWKKVEEEIAKLNLARAGMNMPALPVPSEKAIYRAIKKLDPFRVMAGREGAEVAQRKFAIVHDGVRPQRLLERVEMDVWKVTITALLVDTETWERMTPVERKQVTRVRCYITAAIDCASRCLLALYLHVDAPSGASSIAALQMITEDKARLSEATGLSTVWFMRGRPELLVTDGGPEFKDHRFRGAVADLRVAHQYARPKHPQDRGTIERFFETIEEYLSAEFSGRTFRNVGERGEYEAGEQANLTVDQLREVLPMLVNRYHNTKHEGLGQETPLDAWKRLARECSVRPAPSPSEARNIFGIRTARRISGRGVRFLGLHYNSRDVQELRRTINQREAQIRIDPQDLGEISIHTEQGWVSVKCVEDFAKGVSAEEWIAANTRLRQRFAAQAEIARPALMEAIEAIREIARNAHRTAGLKPTVITDKEFKAAEQNLLRTFRIRDGAASPATDDDVLGIAEADAFSSAADDHLEESDEDHDDIADAGDMDLEDN